MNSSAASVLSQILFVTSKRTVSNRKKCDHTCSVQLYLPPEYMLNKDFLKEVFIEEKSLLRLDQVKWINAPLYDELSVINLWPMMKDDENFRRFFPSKMAKGRVPDREYFFNVLNTFHQKYVEQIIRHANEQRNSVSNDAIAKEAIEVSDDWWQALNAVPFISCKWRSVLLITNFLLICLQSRRVERYICLSKVRSQYHRSGSDERLTSKERSNSLFRRRRKKSRSNLRQRRHKPANLHLHKVWSSTIKVQPIIMLPSLILLATLKMIKVCSCHKKKRLLCSVLQM